MTRRTCALSDAEVRRFRLAVVRRVEPSATPEESSLDSVPYSSAPLRRSPSAAVSPAVPAQPVSATVTLSTVSRSVFMDAPLCEACAASTAAGRTLGFTNALQFESKVFSPESEQIPVDCPNQSKSVGLSPRVTAWRGRVGVLSSRAMKHKRRIGAVVAVLLVAGWALWTWRPRPGSIELLEDEPAVDAGAPSGAVKSATSKATTALAPDAGVPEARTGGGQVLASFGWGNGEGNLGHSRPDEANPEAPMSLTVDALGQVWILDQVNERLMKLDRSGKQVGTMPLTVQAAQDVVIAPTAPRWCWTGWWTSRSR